MAFVAKVEFVYFDANRVEHKDTILLDDQINKDMSIREIQEIAKREIFKEKGIQKPLIGLIKAI